MSSLQSTSLIFGKSVKASIRTVAEALMLRVVGVASLSNGSLSVVGSSLEALD